MDNKIAVLPDRPLPYGTLVSSELLEAIIARIAESLNPEKIVLFGSYAQGNPGPDSDLDLLIVMKTDEPKGKRSVMIRDLFDPQPCPMDILVYTPEEIDYWNGTKNHIISEAMNTGKVCHER